jgi:hypothetical protein
VIYITDAESIPRIRAVPNSKPHVTGYPECPDNDERQRTRPTSPGVEAV